MDLKTAAKSIVFEDKEPTHYVDLGMTKDKKFLIISSNTKEDSEVLVLPRDEESEKQDQKPVVLLRR